MRDRLAGNIRAELARQRIPASALAGPLGIAESSVSRRLNGETTFYGYEIAIIAAVLDVPITRLYDDVARMGENVTRSTGPRWVPK